MIEITELTKVFRDRKRGPVKAVDNVTFDCRAGEVFGLLGPNGAGKTTVLRLISTALRPTAGSGKVMGYDFVHEPTDVRRSIGFLAANTGLYGRLSPREVLRYFGRLFAMKEKLINERIDKLTVEFDMEEFIERPCDKLSTGMKQRLNIARAILHDPPVMILDEPTAGLDVLAARNIVEFIRRSRADGKTVLLSTHVMTEVDKLCDQVGIIHRGKLLFLGPVLEFRKSYGQDLEEGFIKLVEEQEA